MSLTDKIIRVATLPSLVGASTALISSFVFGLSFDNQSALPFIGIQLPDPIVEGITAAVASEVAEFGADFILPHIQGDDKLVRIERMVLKPAITGAATAGLAWFNNAAPSVEVLGKHALIGASGEMAGTYIYRSAKEMLSQ